MKGKKYPIQIDFYENRQNARIHLYWSADSFPREIVPQSQLFISKEKEIGDGLSAIYRSKAPYLCYTKNKENIYAITLEWPGKELVLPIGQPTKKMKISLLGRQGFFDYQYLDGKVHVDLSQIYHNDLPCLFAWTFKIEEF